MISRIISGDMLVLLLAEQLKKSCIDGSMKAMIHYATAYVPYHTRCRNAVILLISVGGVASRFASFASNTKEPSSGRAEGCHQTGASISSLD